MDSFAVLGVIYAGVVLLGVFIWLSFAFGTARSASRRGHRWLVWFICGLFLGPLALCFALSLHDYRRGRGGSQ